MDAGAWSEPCGGVPQLGGCCCTSDPPQRSPPGAAPDTRVWRNADNQTGAGTPRPQWGGVRCEEITVVLPHRDAGCRDRPAVPSRNAPCSRIGSPPTGTLQLGPASGSVRTRRPRYGPHVRRRCCNVKARCPTTTFQGLRASNVRCNLRRSRSGARRGMAAAGQPRRRVSVSFHDLGQFTAMCAVPERSAQTPCPDREAWGPRGSASAASQFGRQPTRWANGETDPAGWGNNGPGGRRCDK